MRVLILLILGLMAAPAGAQDEPPRQQTPQGAKAGDVKADKPDYFTGFYIGGIAGGEDTELTFDLDSGGSISGSGNGAVFGGVIGYGVTFGQWITGIEADFVSSQVAFDLPLFGVPQPVDEQVTLGLSVRIGRVFGRVMPYASVGFSSSNFNFAETSPLFDFSELSTFYGGIRAGGGIEIALTDRISIRGEFLQTFEGISREGEFTVTETVFGIPFTETEAFSAGVSRSAFTGGILFYF